MFIGMVLGFEHTTFWTRISSQNHLTRASLIILLNVNLLPKPLDQSSPIIVNCFWKCWFLSSVLKSINNFNHRNLRAQIVQKIWQWCSSVGIDSGCFWFQRSSVWIQSSAKIYMYWTLTVNRIEKKGGRELPIFETVHKITMVMTS